MPTPQLLRDDIVAIGGATSWMAATGDQVQREWRAAVPIIGVAADVLTLPSSSTFQAGDIVRVISLAGVSGPTHSTQSIAAIVSGTQVRLDGPPVPPIAPAGGGGGFYLALETRGGAPQRRTVFSSPEGAAAATNVQSPNDLANRAGSIKAYLNPGFNAEYELDSLSNVQYVGPRTIPPDAIVVAPKWDGVTSMRGGYRTRHIRDTSSHTAGIQEALDALPGGVGTVVLAGGVYLISGAIYMSSNQRLLLMPDAIIRIADGALGPDYFGGNRAIVWVNAGSTNVEVAGGTLDGNMDNNLDAAGFPENSYCFIVDHRTAGTTDVFLHDITLKNGVFAGITLGDVAVNNRMTRLRIKRVRTDNFAHRAIEPVMCDKTWIVDCTTTRTAGHSIFPGAGSGTTDPTRAPVDVIMGGNRCLEYEHPTRLISAYTNGPNGFCVGAGDESKNVVCVNNYTNAAWKKGDDSIAVGNGAWGCVTGNRKSNVIVYGNRVVKAGQFGIDMPPTGIVMANEVIDAAAHAIPRAADLLDAGSNFGTLVCVGNTILYTPEWANNPIWGGPPNFMQAIVLSGGGSDPRASSATGVDYLEGEIVAYNTVIDRGNAAGAYIWIETTARDLTKTVHRSVIIAHNRFDGCPQMSWGGLNSRPGTARAAQILRLLWHNNMVTNSVEPNRGTVFFNRFKGLNAPSWPTNITLRFHTTRLDGPGSTTGVLAGSDQLVLRTYVRGTSNLAADNCEALWELAGIIP